MAIELPLSARPHDRFPGLRIRPAEPDDFPRMARMANAVFQHERDIDYFNKNHRVKMGCEREAEVADQLLQADSDYRLGQLRLNSRIPGRRLILATYVKKLPSYLLSGMRRKEEILGWAEWQAPQDPGDISDPSSYINNLNENGQNSENTGGSSSLGHLEQIVKDLSFRHRRQGLFVPPNGLAVNLGDALQSFRRAQAEHQHKWKRWCDDIIPTCLGAEGDAHGKHLVLRTLVISPTHWDNGIGTYLIDWGKLWARAQGWAIRTLASGISESTLGTLRCAGFAELGRMDILRDTQIALEWRDRNNKRGLLREQQKLMEEGGEKVEEVGEMKCKRRKLEPVQVGVCGVVAGGGCFGEAVKKVVGEL